MNLEYIPLREFSERLAMGWRLASELKPGDYAAVMEAPRKRHSNTRAAYLSRGPIPFAGYDATEEA